MLLAGKGRKRGNQSLAKGVKAPFTGFDHYKGKKGEGKKNPNKIKRRKRKKKEIFFDEPSFRKGRKRGGEKRKKRRDTS